MPDRLTGADRSEIDRRVDERFRNRVSGRVIMKRRDLIGLGVGVLTLGLLAGSGATLAINAWTDSRKPKRDEEGRLTREFVQQSLASIDERMKKEGATLELSGQVAQLSVEAFLQHNGKPPALASDILARFRILDPQAYATEVLQSNTCVTDSYDASSAGSAGFADSATNEIYVNRGISGPNQSSRSSDLFATMTNLIYYNSPPITTPRDLLLIDNGTGIHTPHSTSKGFALNTQSPYLALPGKTCDTGVGFKASQAFVAKEARSLRDHFGVTPSSDFSAYQAIFEKFMEDHVYKPGLITPAEAKEKYFTSQGISFFTLVGRRIEPRNPDPLSVGVRHFNSLP